MLVLAGGVDPIYQTFESLWQRYMRKCPEVDCYIYKGDPTLKEEYVLDDVSKVLYIRVDDSITHTFEKMIKAFQFFEPQIENYDFIFRTNLSSFLVLDRYVAYCRNQERERFCSAVIGYGGHIFPSGSGFTLTPDVAKYVIKNSCTDTQVIDDVALGKVLIQGNYRIRPAPRTDLLDMNVSPLCLTDPTTFHFRIKSNNRLYDTEVYERLVHYFFTNKECK